MQQVCFGGREPFEQAAQCSGGPCMPCQWREHVMQCVEDIGPTHGSALCQSCRDYCCVGSSAEYQWLGLSCSSPLVLASRKTFFWLSLPEKCCGGSSNQQQEQYLSCVGKAQLASGIEVPGLSDIQILCNMAFASKTNLTKLTKLRWKGSACD